MKKNPRSGYAVLLIFCMAAVVAIGLYSRLPRVAFEAQRDKEELLVDRGQQFSRAVALYVRKFKRFPATMEALEDTNGQRFLRHRYKDPLTGKDEWRVIHVGPNGVFTDSLVYKKKDDKGEQNTNTYIADFGAPGASANNPNAGVNLAMRTRPSDGPGAPGTGDPNNPPAPVDPNNPAPVLPPGMGVQGRQGSLLPGQPGPAVTSATAGNTQYATTPGANGNTPSPFGGQQPGTTGAASDMIRNLLTSPRPGGANGIGTPVAQQPTQTTIDGGIAGIASKVEREGIKVFNERTAYNEWEFVYDLSKDPAMANGGGAAAGQQRTGQNGQPAQVGNGLTPVSVIPGQPVPVVPPKQ